jgi:hypothetical protein
VPVQVRDMPAPARMLWNAPERLRFKLNARVYCTDAVGRSGDVASA